MIIEKDYKKQCLDVMVQEQNSILNNDALTFEQKAKLSTSIIDDLINDVVNYYAESKNVAVSNGKMENSVEFNQFIIKNNVKILYKKQIDTQNLLIHPQVYDQHVEGTCGYHSLFNLMNVSQLLRSQNYNSPYSLEKPAYFWDFHIQCTKLLKKISQKQGLEWCDKDIDEGELERIFLKWLIKVNNFPINYLTKAEKTFNCEFFVLDFQFSHFVAFYNEDEFLELQIAIDKFKKKKIKLGQHEVMFFILGVTNHWISFVAHKTQTTEFIVLDSRNAPFYEWNEANAVEWVKNQDKEDIKDGKKPLSEFEKKIRVQSLMDSKQLIQLLIDCFLGKENLVNFRMDILNLQAEEIDSSLTDLASYKVGGHNTYADPPIRSSARSTICQYLKGIKQSIQYYHYISRENQERIIDFLSKHQTALNDFTKNSKNRWASKMKDQWDGVWTFFKKEFQSKAKSLK